MNWYGFCFVRLLLFCNHWQSLLLFSVGGAVRFNDPCSLGVEVFGFIFSCVVWGEVYLGIGPITSAKPKTSVCTTSSANSTFCPFVPRQMLQWPWWTGMTQVWVNWPIVHQLFQQVWERRRTQTWKHINTSSAGTFAEERAPFGVSNTAPWGPCCCCACAPTWPGLRTIWSLTTTRPWV